MSKTSLKQGIAEKWGNCSNVSKTILKQDIEGSLGYCANGAMGVSSPVSNTRLNQGSEGNGGIAPICLRQLRSKTLREVRDIAPIVQWYLAHHI